MSKEVLKDDKQTKTQKDDALFEALGKSKKKRKRKIIRTIIIVIVVIALVLFIGVSYLQRQVRENFAASIGEVQSYDVTTGTISTVVSGSGTLTDVDLESISVPSGVTVDEVFVDTNETVAEGTVLATVDMASVRSTIADLQVELNDLDEQISDAESDEVSETVKAGVSGRVKIIYAEKNVDVAACMVENGALAVLSLDGYMALDIETSAFAVGDAVTVVRADGDEITGTVETVANGIATILVTDKGPQYDEEVTVIDEEGTTIGTAKLYINNPLSVTGYAGTVSKVHVDENDWVDDNDTVFTLKDTSYSTNYDSLLRERSEKEEILIELLTIQRNGAILSPISGSVYSIASTSSDDTSEELEVLTLSPDISMSVTISVDESDILSLEIGQEADVTVSSVSEDAFTGTVTEINRSVSESSGTYSAVVTLSKKSGMLSGMTASVDVVIQGVENAIIIPIEALHQTRDTAYVYTEYDEETQEYGGQVNVNIGISNSNYVEITSGLEAGDVVYYTESETGFDFSSMGGFGGMGGMGGFGGGSGGEMPDMGGFTSDGEMPDMGNMPSRGEMPSGGERPSMPGGFGE